MSKKQNRKMDNSLDILSKIGIFSLSLFVTATAVYFYSLVIKSHAEEGATLNVAANIGSVIALTLDANELNLSTNPNNFVHDSLNVSVSTNSQFGYTLTLEDADDSSNMTHTNSSITDVVTSAFTGSKTSGDMESNTWGFSLDNTNYYSIPVLGSPVALKRTNTTMETAYETTAVDFGVKVGMLTAGSYRDTVRFTAYVNGIDGNPDDGTTPSDPGGGETMQEFSCSELSNVNDSIILTDTRDGNRYTVKKLADGNCWMTENLRIINKTISNTDSNLPEGTTWTIPASSTSGFGFVLSNNNKAYLDSTYGGYYTFYTATAGWGKISLNSGDAKQDICPKGWRLPTAGSYGEFQTLYKNYKSSALMQGDPGFVLSGYVFNDSVGGQGSTGFYWSSTIFAENTAHSLKITSSEVEKADRTIKGRGCSVRCIAK